MTKQVQGWVEAYGPRLFRAAALKASPEEAADLCQEVFLVATRSRFEGRSSPYTWLYGILHNLVRDHQPSRPNRTAGTSNIPSSHHSRW